MTVEQVWAQVNNEGVMSSTHNMKTCVHVDKGSYILEYNFNFCESPCVQVTPIFVNVTVSLDILALNSARVSVRDGTGNPVNAGFMYLAVGIV